MKSLESDKFKRYADWIVANKDKKGTPEFETVAAEYKALRTQQAESNPDLKPNFDYGDPSVNMSQFDLVRAGAGKGLTDAAVGLGQLTGFISDEDVQARKERDAPLMERPAAMGGHFAGTMAAYAPTALIPGATSVLGSAAIGAGVGAAQPVGEDDSRAANMAFGTLGGAVGAKIGKALNPEVDGRIAALMDEGITPTPGQIMGGGWRKAEEMARSIPVVGSFIEGAEQRTMQQFNKAAINRALKPIGLKTDQVGRKGIEYARQEIGDAYEKALAKIPQVEADGQLYDDIGKILKKASSELPDEQFNYLSKFLEPRIVNKMTGQSMKQLDSELGQEAVGMASDASFVNRKLAGFVRDVQSSLRELVERSFPDAAPDLKAANAAFSNLKRVERAAGAIGAEEGVFTPAQLQAAVRALDKSKDKVNFSTYGKALMQDLSEPAKSVLGNRQPDSGTAGRLMTAAGLLNPTDPRNLYRIPMAVGAGMAYSPTGQSALAHALTSRPQAVRELGKKVSQNPYISALLAPVTAIEASQ